MSNNKIGFFLTLLVIFSFSFLAKAEDMPKSEDEGYAIGNYDGDATDDDVIFDNEPEFDSSKTKRPAKITSSNVGSDLEENIKPDEPTLPNTSETSEDENIPGIDQEEAPVVEYPDKTLDEVDQANFADTVVLQGLDKITAKSSYLEAKVGDKIVFKRLEIYPIKCWKSPPEEKPENKILLKIYENKLNGEREEIFYGWMFSSSPALSTLEHPVYDVTAIDCKFNQTETGAEGNEK